ncbi:hypothetical protein D3C80_1497250 [compost metagenome]
MADGIVAPGALVQVVLDLGFTPIGEALGQQRVDMVGRPGRWLGIGTGTDGDAGVPVFFIERGVMVEFDHLILAQKGRRCPVEADPADFAFIGIDQRTVMASS